MPFYVGDYIRKTQHLTTEQHGAYLLLLFAMFASGGSLPNDDRKLARISRLSNTKWASNRNDLLEFFTLDGDVITHTKVTEVSQNYQKKIQKLAQNGSKGGIAKSLKDNRLGLANAIDLPCQPEPEPEPNYIDTDVSITPIVPKVSKPKIIAGKFEEFWSIYPKKQSRGQAESAYAKANKQADHDEIISGLHRSIQSDHRFQNKQYTPMASTWLNAKGYFDDFSGTNNQTRFNGGSNQHTQSSGSQRQRTGYELAMAAVANLEERERMDGFNPDGRLL